MNFAMPGNPGICFESRCPLNNGNGGCNAPQVYQGHIIELAGIASQCLLPETVVNLETFLRVELVELIEAKTGQKVGADTTAEDLYAFVAQQFGEELLTITAKTSPEEIAHIFA